MTQKFHIRPLQNDDAKRLSALLGHLSMEERRWRFFHTITSFSPQLINMLLVHAPGTHWAFGAFDEHQNLLGVVHAARVAGARSAEFAITVPKPFAHRGVGRSLIDHLRHVLVNEGVTHWHATVFEDNHRMKEFCRHQGLSTHWGDEPGVLRVDGRIADHDLTLKPAHVSGLKNAIQASSKENLEKSPDAEAVPIKHVPNCC